MVVGPEQTSFPDFLVGTDFDGLMVWIDNYCRANPLDTIGAAEVALRPNWNRGRDSFARQLTLQSCWA